MTIPRVVLFFTDTQWSVRDCIVLTFALKFYLTYKRGCESRDLRKHSSAGFRSIVEVGRDVSVATFTRILSEVGVGIGCTIAHATPITVQPPIAPSLCTYRIFSRPRLFSVGDV